MKITLYSIPFILLLFSLSCDENNNPVSTSPVRTIVITEYGTAIDSSYYKVWSDGSWEKFYHVNSVNDKMYVTIINSDSAIFYYDENGYAGFKPKNGPIILFDTPMTSIPETLAFGKTYTSQTTFWVDGYEYLMKNEQSVDDTVSVTVPIGTFTSCLWITFKSTISSGGQSETSSGQAWLAKGPGDIKLILNSGATIEMVRGFVNGQAWGMPLAKKHFGETSDSKLQFQSRVLRPMFRIQSN